MDIQGWLSGGAVGALLGAAATHIFSKLRAREDRAVGRFNAAAAELHAAFADEVAFTRSSILKSGATYEKLAKAFPKHDLAVAKFREFVAPDERPAFDAAWRAYYHPKGIDLLASRQEAMLHLLIQYDSANDEEEAAARASASSAIKSILNFARQK
jgi:hypothetical protein